jgi:hypothetical protein
MLASVLMLDRSWIHTSKVVGDAGYWLRNRSLRRNESYCQPFVQSFFSFFIVLARLDCKRGQHQSREYSHTDALEGKDMAGQPAEDGIGADVSRLEVRVLGKEFVQCPRLTQVAIDEGCAARIPIVHDEHRFLLDHRGAKVERLLGARVNVHVDHNHARVRDAVPRYCFSLSVSLNQPLIRMARFSGTPASASLCLVSS